MDLPMKDGGCSILMLVCVPEGMAASTRHWPSHCIRMSPRTRSCCSFRAAARLKMSLDVRIWDVAHVYIAFICRLICRLKKNRKKQQINK